MADPRFVAVYIPDTEPELQALVKGWRETNVNVSREFVLALKEKHINPQIGLSAEGLKRVKMLIEILEGRRVI